MELWFTAATVALCWSALILGLRQAARDIVDLIGGA